MTIPFSLKNLNYVGFYNFFSEPISSESSQVFYSLHTPDMEPLYVSEIVTPVSGLSFGKLTIPRLPRQFYNAVVKIWRKSGKNWQLHYEEVVDLRKLVPLQYPSRELDDDCLRDNSVVWSFNEVEYVSPEKVNDKSIVDHGGSVTPNRGRNVSKISYTIDDIRHLQSLDTGIKELALSNIKISQQIDAALEALEGKVSENDPEVTRALKFRIHNLHRHITKQRNNNDTVSSKVYERRILLGEITSALEDKFPPFKEFCEGQLDYVSSQIEPIHEALDAAVCPELFSSLKAIGSVIAEAFCIDSTLGSNKFSILDTEIPSSTKELLEVCYDSRRDLVVEDSSPIDKINAGLSYIVALMLLLADVLGVSLNYAMTYFGSRSSIVDHIQLPDTKERHGKYSSITVKYPLFYDSRHAERTTISDRDGKRVQIRNVRFEQGLQLLHRNLATLTSAVSNAYWQIYHGGEHQQGLGTPLPSESVDNLLWNIKYLILLMTAPEQAKKLKMPADVN